MKIPALNITKIGDINMEKIMDLPKAFYTGKNTYLKTYKDIEFSEQEELELVLDVEGLILKSVRSLN